MPQHPITGDAGSRRRPRAMDAQRRAAWKAALEKRKAGRAVWEMPAGVHAALLRPGPRQMAAVLIHNGLNPGVGGQ